MGSEKTLDGGEKTSVFPPSHSQGKKPAHVEIVVANVPATLRSQALVVRRYVIDSAHSNCFVSPDASGGLEMVTERQIDSRTGFQLSAELEPMALCLWKIEKAPAKP